MNFNSLQKIILMIASAHYTPILHIDIHIIYRYTDTFFLSTIQCVLCTTVSCLELTDCRVESLPSDNNNNELCWVDT